MHFDGNIKEEQTLGMTIKKQYSLLLLHTDVLKIIIAADWGSSSYRKELSPDYKQNRKEKFAEQSEEERIAFEEFFEEFEATLEVLAEDYIFFATKV